MVTIKDPNLVPPGGAFVYRHKISGAEFKHHTVPRLYEMVHQHCASNGYEFSNAEFYQNVCENAHPQVCHNIDDATGLPPLTQRVASFTKAVVSWGRSGFKMSDDEMFQHRLGICQSCPFYGGESGGNYFGITCRKCGCSGLKLKWKNSKCPLGSW